MKAVIILCLGILLAGGGRVCIHNVVSPFDTHGHHHSCCEHGNHHDSEEPDTSPDHDPCDCDHEGFVGQLPSAIELEDRVGSSLAFSVTHDVDFENPALIFQARWKHPPPPELEVGFYLSLSVLQRYNV